MVSESITLQQRLSYGITGSCELVYNPGYDKFFPEETDPPLRGFDGGTLTQLGAVAVDTGIFTGRLPFDKYVVRDDKIRNTRGGPTRANAQ